MPRNISFALTTNQFRNRTKKVTRRLGWINAKPGEVLNGCVKCMGLKPGEKIERLGQIRIIDVRREALDRMEREPEYGKAEAIAEGFPEMSGEEFVTMFAGNMRVHRNEMVTRIEFEYMEASDDA